MHVPKVVIVARDKNGVIGKDGGIPWKLSKDMKHFKATTTGYPVIMGRKTWDSFEGYKLPNRTLIVVTRKEDLHIDGAHVVNNLEDAIEIAEAVARKVEVPKVFIIGGGEIYTHVMDEIADTVIVSEVDCEVVDGDAKFPEFDMHREWTRNEVISHTKDEKNNHDFEIVTYNRM